MGPLRRRSPCTRITTLAFLASPGLTVTETGTLVTGYEEPGTTVWNDLVYSVLHPLRQARGGPGPLVETLAAYFDSGCVATAAAARLHLSVRAVTYRLDRVRSLTGFDPLDPAHRYTLQTAVLGAKLLDWPDRRLPDSAAGS